MYSQINKFTGTGFGGLTAALLASGAGLKTMEIWLNNDIPKLTTGKRMEKFNNIHRVLCFYIILA